MSSFKDKVVLFRVWHCFTLSGSGGPVKPLRGALECREPAWYVPGAPGGGHTMCSHAVRMPLWLVKIFVLQLRASAASPAKNGDRCPHFGLEGSLLTLLTF